MILRQLTDSQILFFFRTIEQIFPIIHKNYCLSLLRFENRSSDNIPPGPTFLCKGHRTPFLKTPTIPV